MEIIRCMLIILVFSCVFFLMLYIKKARIAVLVIGTLLLCTVIFTPIIVKEMGTPVKDELSGEIHYEYRYPGKTEEQAVKVMERFLWWSAGMNAKYYVRESRGTDWRFVYRNIKTDSYYSFRIEGEEIVICDNTKGVKLQRIKQRINAYFKKYTLEGNYDRLNKEAEAYLSTENGTPQNIEINLYYSAQNDIYYDFLQYDVVYSGHTTHKEKLFQIREAFETKPEQDYHGNSEMTKGN